MEVLNDQDKPIPGLYAAGVDTGGGNQIPTVLSLPGQHLALPLIQAALREKTQRNMCRINYEASSMRGAAYELGLSQL